MEYLSSFTKWGDRDSTHVKLTPSLKKFLLKRLEMDINSGLKDYHYKFDQQKATDLISIPSKAIIKFKEILGEENVSSDLTTRLQNSFDQSYLNLLTSRLGRPFGVTELVLYPKSHNEVLMVIKIANEFEIPIFTVSGHSSVTLGIKPPEGSVAINLTKMNQVLRIDKESNWAIVQTGISGPVLEEILNKEGLTLGHFPQSFEYSCLGGWLATRGAGQNSSLYGKIEDMVLGLKFVTGSGETLETKMSPARSTGPDLNQLLIGSEGAFGIITEATLRVSKLPPKRYYASFLFRSFEDGLLAFREILQRGYRPSVMRLSDPEETSDHIKSSYLMKDHPKQPKFVKLFFKYLVSRGYTEEKSSLGILSFEGDPALTKVTKKESSRIIKKYGGHSLGSGVAKSWFETRFESPFLRDPLIDHGILLDTFETSTTWDNLFNLYVKVREKLKPICPILWSHCSHAYPTGANLYFTIMMEQKLGSEINQYIKLRKMVLDAFQEYGGTLSHHHGIGRSFSQWLPKEIGEQGIIILKSLKEVLDPKGIMNPGVLNL
ncbi:MAG: FAD-binding oxidoreductase [Candidatus Hodarchaeales archaeon]